MSGNLSLWLLVSVHSELCDLPLCSGFIATGVFIYFSLSSLLFTVVDCCELCQEKLSASFDRLLTGAGWKALPLP